MRAVPRTGNSVEPKYAVVYDHGEDSTFRESGSPTWRPLSRRNAVTLPSWSDDARAVDGRRGPCGQGVALQKRAGLWPVDRNASPCQPTTAAVAEVGGNHTDPPRSDNRARRAAEVDRGRQRRCGSPPKTGLTLGRLRRSLTLVASLRRGVGVPQRARRTRRELRVEPRRACRSAGVGERHPPSATDKTTTHATFRDSSHYDDGLDVSASGLTSASTARTRRVCLRLAAPKLPNAGHGLLDRASVTTTGGDSAFVRHSAIARARRRADEVGDATLAHRSCRTTSGSSRCRGGPPASESTNSRLGDTS